MSERKLTRMKSESMDNDPIVAYFQMKQPEKPHPKVKVLKKGQKLTGTYEHTFVDGKYSNHLIKTDKGKITIKGCKALAGLATLAKGTYVEITYKGEGVAKKGNKAPYLFTVDWDDSNAGAALDSTDVEETEETEADNDPF